LQIKIDGVKATAWLNDIGTNATANAAEQIAASGLSQVFADVVNSAEVGVGAGGNGAAAAEAAIQGDALG
jgi:hypothetical protein